MSQAAIERPLPYIKEKTSGFKLRKLETSQLRLIALALYAALTAANTTSWSRLLANRLSERYCKGSRLVNTTL
jgi:hypothetical protein